ncbi:MAG: HEAT repeat domain-containing protein [Polyangiaceae bacterium]|nr:HEAT repeat domain-containing protein [Polyangiaceae bacterium]
MKHGIASVLFVAAFAVAGCGREPRSPAEVMAGLRSPDPRDRADAAKELRAHKGPPAEAVPALFEAIQTEQDNKAYAEMMITLAHSGAPQAEPFICAKIYDADANMRRWASQALKTWLPKNRQSKGCPPPQ